MRCLFAGTPEVAAISLRALLASDHEVVAVLSRPDAPAGRGRTLTPSPVSAMALDAGIEVLRPFSPHDPDFQARLIELAPECCPVVAYGGLIPGSLLQVPTFGWVNLHFSLLPSWRGAAPVQHAVWAGDSVTGATTFVLDEGMDTGPILDSITEEIGAQDTSGDVLDRLAHRGAALLVSSLTGLADGSLQPVPQSGPSSAAPKISVEDAHIDWTQPAEVIDRTIRAMTPLPGAWTTVQGERIRLLPVTTMSLSPEIPPGTLRLGSRDVLVGTGTAPVRLSDVRPAGKRLMAASDWFRGARLPSDAAFE